MRLGRRPGAFIAIVDAFTEESFLRFQCDEQDIDLVEFKLFDRDGAVTAESHGLQTYPDGLTVCDAQGELLLLVPSNREDNIQYRIYNTQGTLLTCSDGKRTQLYPGVRVLGNRQLSGRPPGSKAT